MLSYFFEASIAHITTAAAKTIIAVSSTMSDISSLEKQASDLIRGINNWNRVYVWALGVALLAGAFSFWAQRQAISRSRELVTVSNDLSKEKDRQLQRDLREKDDQISKTNERAAGLEKETVELKLKLEEVKKRQDRRIADWSKFTEALKGKPKCDIEILCQPNDSEAYSLAMILSTMLATSGWPLVQPKPISDDMGTQPPTKMNVGGKIVDMPAKGQEIFTNLFKSQPPTTRAGAAGALNTVPFGIFVVANKEISLPLDLNTPYGALVNAFNEVGLPAGGGVADLPSGKLRIIVGEKP